MVGSISQCHGKRFCWESGGRVGEKRSEKKVWVEARMEVGSESTCLSVPRTDCMEAEPPFDVVDLEKSILWAALGFVWRRLRSLVWVCVRRLLFTFASAC